MQGSGYITKEGSTRMQDYKVLFHKGISSEHEMPIDWWNFFTMLNYISPAWDWFNQNFIMEGGEDQEGPRLLEGWLSFIGCWLRMCHFHHPLQSTQCSSKYSPTNVQTSISDQTQKVTNTLTHRQMFERDFLERRGFQVNRQCDVRRQWVKVTKVHNIYAWNCQTLNEYLN